MLQGPGVFSRGFFIFGSIFWNVPSRKVERVLELRALIASSDSNDSHAAIDELSSDGYLSWCRKRAGTIAITRA
jgi:hypothetical protein